MLDGFGIRVVALLLTGLAAQSGLAGAGTTFSFGRMHGKTTGMASRGGDIKIAKPLALEEKKIVQVDTAVWQPGNVHVGREFNLLRGGEKGSHLRQNALERLYGLASQRTVSDPDVQDARVAIGLLLSQHLIDDRKIKAEVWAKVVLDTADVSLQGKDFKIHAVATALELCFSHGVSARLCERIVATLYLLDDDHIERPLSAMRLYLLAIARMKQFASEALMPLDETVVLLKKAMPFHRADTTVGANLRMAFVMLHDFQKTKTSAWAGIGRHELDEVLYELAAKAPELFVREHCRKRLADP